MSAQSAGLESRQVQVLPCCQLIAHSTYRDLLLMINCIHNSIGSREERQRELCYCSCCCNRGRLKRVGGPFHS